MTLKHAPLYLDSECPALHFFLINICFLFTVYSHMCTPLIAIFLTSLCISVDC